MINIKVLQSEPKMTKTGKPYKALTVDVDGDVRKVNMWSNFPDFANINEESVFLGNMVKEGAYWNLSHDATEKRSTGSFQANKTVSIDKAMDKKATNIKEAQDRSAWMWAKTNACTLLGDRMKEWLNQDDIANEVLSLATKIYNGEPTEPF